MSESFARGKMFWTVLAELYLISDVRILPDGILQGLFGNCRSVPCPYLLEAQWLDLAGTDGGGVSGARASAGVALGHVVWRASCGPALSGNEAPLETSLAHPVHDREPQTCAEVVCG